MILIAEPLFEVKSRAADVKAVAMTNNPMQLSFSFPAGARKRSRLKQIIKTKRNEMKHCNANARQNNYCKYL